MELLNEMISTISGYLWNVVLIVLLCGTGVYYTIRLRFVQVRRFKTGLKQVFGHMISGDKTAGEGEMTPFQSVATAIAAQVGTGNLTGAATALLSGGPGAIFWMWVSAFFGMATIYAEAVLAQEYRVTEDGEVTGGPVYYIRAAFRGKAGKVLAACFAVFIIVALGFCGNMVQSNSIGSAFTEVFSARGIHVPPVCIGLVLAAVSGFVFLGGVSRLAAVVEKMIPFMAAIYIVGSLVLILLHIRELPSAVWMIFAGAFSPEAVLGAGAGITIREAIRYGVARGLFSNEAGMGSTPHAHARARVENPHQQGLAAMVSVFIDTFVILNLTVFSILTTGVLHSGKQGTALTQAAFNRGFAGLGDLFVAVCLLFFAFSTILGWHFFGQVNVKYLFGEGACRLYSVLVVIFVVIGSALKVDLVWNLSDFFNGLMVIPNALALWALAGRVVKISRQYGREPS